MEKRKAAKNGRKARKTPAQGRSQETVAVIVEAAARVLEEKGLSGFNTNAVAERAGVSIGSLYQYFRNKEALLARLIERQAEPFVQTLESTAQGGSFHDALRGVITASVQQQLQRPELARVLDFLERQSVFEDQAKRTVNHIQSVMIDLLRRPGAPPLDDYAQASLEFISIVRALTDVAGERGERHPDKLMQRIYRTACGYFDVSPWRKMRDRGSPYHAEHE